MRQIIDTHELHLSSHRLATSLWPQRPSSDVVFTVLTGAPINNELRRCDIKLEEHIDDWTIINRRVYLALMRREVLRLAPCCS